MTTDGSTGLRAAFERCCARFPTIELPLEAFAARVAEIGPDPDTLQYEDLFLATACARGDRIAWEYFADLYLPALRQFAARACRNLQESEDLAQQLVSTLLEQRSRLAGYNGRGTLAAWLRVAVAHAAIDRFRKTSRQVPLEGLKEERDGSQPSCRQEPDSDRTDARWGPVMCRILTDRIRKLPAGDRLILALYFLHSVPLKAIGRQFGIHESTVSRRLDSVRQRIRKEVTREMRRQHGLKTREVESVWVWASQVEDFSLERALGQAGRVQSGEFDIQSADSGG